MSETSTDELIPINSPADSPNNESPSGSSSAPSSDLGAESTSASGSVTSTSPSKEADSKAASSAKTEAETLIKEKERDEALTQRKPFRTDKLTSDDLRLIPEVSSYKWLMAALGLFYFFIAGFYFLRPSLLHDLINIGPHVFGITKALPYPTEAFYQMQAISLMLTLGTLSWLNARSPLNFGLAWAQVVPHAAAAAGFIYLIIHSSEENHYFGYYVASAYTIFMVVLLVYAVTKTGLSIRKAKRRKLLHGNIWGNSEDHQ